MGSRRRRREGLALLALAACGGPAKSTPIANTAPSSAVAQPPRCTDAPPKCAPAPLAGQVAVVTVCASWANPCAHQMPVLAQIARNARVIVVSADDASKDELTGQGWALGDVSVILGSDPAYVGYHDVPDVPTTFVYDRSGAQVQSWVGFVQADALGAAVAAAR